jgi:hypothetical protein
VRHCLANRCDAGRHRKAGQPVVVMIQNHAPGRSRSACRAMNTASAEILFLITYGTHREKRLALFL